MGRIADCAIIASPDIDHHYQTLALAKQGYHVFLEKPMAVTEQQCMDICNVFKGDQILAICHVLRQVNFYQNLFHYFDKFEGDFFQIYIRCQKLFLDELK